MPSTIGKGKLVTNLTSEYVLLTDFNGEYKIMVEGDSMKDIINQLQKLLDDARETKRKNV